MQPCFHGFLWRFSLIYSVILPGGVRCRLLVSLESTISLTDAIQVVVLGYAVNNLLPARLGEFFRAGLLSERTGLPYVQTLTVTVLERIFDGLALLFFLAIACLIFPANFAVSSLRFAGLLFGTMAVILFFMRIFPHSFISLCSRITYLMGPRFHDFMVRAMSHTIQGIGYLKGASELFLISGLSLVVWFLEAGMFLLLLPAFGLSMNIWVALFAMAVTNLAIMIPSTPGYIGTFHFFCMQALVVTGVNSETAFGFAGLVHLVFYAPITFLGIFIILAYQIRVGETIALAAVSVAGNRCRQESWRPGDLEKTIGRHRKDDRCNCGSHDPAVASFGRCEGNSRNGCSFCAGSNQQSVGSP